VGTAAACSSSPVPEEKFEPTIVLESDIQKGHDNASWRLKTIAYVNMLGQ